MSIVTFILIFIIGNAAIFGAIKFLRFSKKIKQWPSIKGHLNEKWLGKPTHTTTDTPDDMKIFAKYSYFVNGVKYNGENVYALEIMKGERTALSRMTNKTMRSIENDPKVYYNPNKPSESFLLFDRMWIFWILIIVGTLMILFSFLLLIPSARQ